jgi:hypothetical protein
MEFRSEGAGIRSPGLKLSIGLSAGKVTEWFTATNRGDGGTPNATVADGQATWTWVQPTRTYTMTLDRVIGVRSGPWQIRTAMRPVWRPRWS